MKKFIAKLFFISILFVIITPVVSANIFNKSPDLTTAFFQDKIFVVEMENHFIKEYGEDYKRIFERNARSVENAGKIKSLFQANEIGEPLYPEFMGGLYINDDDQLVIQIVDDAIPSTQTIEISAYKNVINVDKNAVVEYVKYSHTKLEKINKIISDYYLENYPNGNISAFYIDVINNRIVVEL